MSDNKNVVDRLEKDQMDVSDSNLAVASDDVSGSAGSVKNIKHSTSSERQIKFERAQKCLENAALVSKRIKEHRKATAELLGKPFDDEVEDTASEMASTMSERTGYSVATDTSTTLSVQDALNIPGISESLANTLKQKELLMERIKQYKEISKRPMKKSAPIKKEIPSDSAPLHDIKKGDNSSVVTKLISTIKEKENVLSVMQVKMKALETTILDLQEKINEKDQIIEAKNKATTLISDSLSKKERDTLDLLEDTRQQMSQMQSNFIAMETEWNDEKQRLLKQISEQEEKIKSLEEANTILEKSRFEIGVSYSKLVEELEVKNKEIEELQEKIQTITKASVLESSLEDNDNDVKEEKGTLEISEMIELTKKIELLEQINCQMRQTNKDLESQISVMYQEQKPTSSSPIKKASPHPTRKGGRNTASKTKSPWSNLSADISHQETEKSNVKNETMMKHELIVQSLNKDILEKEYLLSHKDEIALLNEEIEIANKNMIKVKSNYKVKLKQMQKTIDNFSKVSDANTEIVKLNEELHQLSQKVAELEEEKGNLQLHLVDYDSGRLTESEVYKKLVEVENLADSRLKSITLLETQKFELVQELHVLQQKNNDMEDKLADMAQLQNEHVCSEIKSVQLEEQIDELIASKKELQLQIEDLKVDNEQAWKAIKALEEEKEEVIHKLENYIQENMELTDKLEKLSVEKVSSAESIEMVESLTTQEKLELEEYNKNMGKNLDEIQSETFKVNVPTEDKESMSDLVKQTVELNKRIELYTQERQEVLDKMNKVCAENEELQMRIKILSTECENLTKNVDILEKEKNTLNLLNEELSNQIEILKRERIDIMKETIEIPKPLAIDEGIEGTNVEAPQDEKLAGDKANNRSKSIKQLTKDILKLKATIKEREAEIADSQMKILSLEEQQEKQKELALNNNTLDNKVKQLMEENSQLKRDLETVHKDFGFDQQYKQANDVLQQEMQKIHQEYSMGISARDNRIHELENLLVEYEKQMFSYGNSLQQKDKEIAEYINQITKLNDVSQKLKSTIDLLEEEKSKDQSAELVKSLNKEIIMYQKKLSECEDKLKSLEEEKVQLFAVKAALELQNNDLDLELKNLQDSLTQKQTAIKELQVQQQKYEGDYSTIMLEAKERDEEIHEIKLQLRKESIENEKLRTEISQKNYETEELNKRCDQLNQKLTTISQEKEQFMGLESKIAELSFKLSQSIAQVEEMSKEIKSITENNEHLKIALVKKDDQIKQLTVKNKVVFEMNIPKTEGMTITSTIEQLNEQSDLDLASLHSQIVSEQFVDDIQPLPKKVSESGRLIQAAQSSSHPLEEIHEPTIVAKKSYDCYKEQDSVAEDDPFSSQEGWGFGGEEAEDASLGYSHFNDEIFQLKNENERLKGEVNSINTKLLKAVKKLKELKAANEVLSNELKISKQLSEKSILDTAIENELANNLEVLEKKVQDLNTELEKEKREKEALRKQNEIFKNANDRLTEMKEKMDNEVELWKYNFKQANDKVAALQWGSDSQDSPVLKMSSSQQDKPVNEEVIKLEKENEELQSLLDELNNKNKEITEHCNELINQINELQNTFEARIEELTKQLQIKEAEIYQKTHDYSIVIAQRNEEFENVRKQLIEYEKKIEELTYEKEAELAVIRLKMHESREQNEKIQKELENEKNSLTEALNAKIVECTNLNKQINDLNIVLQEYANKSAEMQEALENQELEIVSLKDEISHMQDLMRSSSSKIEKHVTFSSDTKPSPDSSAASFNKELLDAVPRAELDIALYMLHQRDVRCEELTMELTRLLEERDTLQLRLSDSLRAYEELKSKNKPTESDVSTELGQDSVSELPTFSIEKEQHLVDTHRRKSSRSSSISEFDGEKPQLQAKLSELRSVKHSRDVTLRHDSEQRQLGMRLLQRDVANLPPEALEQLTQAHHTLSRDTQSTPTMLLNWLRGKSTPKVVHM
ncbi:unnamed protein product, partial [Iphiclides podalirius]